MLHKAFAEILREVDGRGYKPPFHVAVVSRNGPHALLTFSRAAEGDGFVVTYGHNNDGVEWLPPAYVLLVDREGRRWVVEFGKKPDTEAPP